MFLPLETGTLPQSKHYIVCISVYFSILENEENEGRRSGTTVQHGSRYYALQEKKFRAQLLWQVCLVSLHSI